MYSEAGSGYYAATGRRSTSPSSPAFFTEPSSLSHMQF
jgi:hypothetical protein